MNDDVNIYDGTDINASLEKKSKNTWIEMFDMIDLTFNNLQQQNKELKRTVNELSSKINKVRAACNLCGNMSTSWAMQRINRVAPSPLPKLKSLTFSVRNCCHAVHERAGKRNVLNCYFGPNPDQACPSALTNIFRTNVTFS